MKAFLCCFQKGKIQSERLKGQGRHDCRLGELRLFEPKERKPRCLLMDGRVGGGITLTLNYTGVLPVLRQPPFVEMEVTDSNPP